MLDLSSLERAVEVFAAVLDRTEDPTLQARLDPVSRQALRAGAIQHFEFTYELAWKFIRRWLGEQLGKDYVLGVTRRALYRLAAEHGLIDDVDAWMRFHRARNLTSHTYNEHTAQEIYRIAVQFLPYAATLLERLQVRND